MSWVPGYFWWTIKKKYDSNEFFGLLRVSPEIFTVSSVQNYSENGRVGKKILIKLRYDFYAFIRIKVGTDLHFLKYTCIERKKFWIFP